MKHERTPLSRGAWFGTVLVCSQFAAPAWAQSDINTTFYNMGVAADAGQVARPQPAIITTDDEATLRSKGYVLIGTVAAQRPDTGGGRQAIDDLGAAILSKAAESGGDLVSRFQSNVHVSADVPTGKTKREWKCTLSHYLYYNRHDPVTDESVRVSQEVCDKEEYYDVPVMRKEKFLAASGFVWRTKVDTVSTGGAPALAASKMSFQDVKVGEDKAQLIALFGEPTSKVPGGSLRGPLHRHEGCVQFWGWISGQSVGSRTTIKSLGVDLDAKGLVCDTDYREVCLDQRPGMTHPEKVVCNPDASQALSTSTHPH